MTNQAVEKCIHILESAKNDNEQFAGLLMVAKVVKAEECDGETLQRVFEAIGFPFLIRLLKSSQVPDGCSQNVYKNLAVTVLSCFLQNPELALHPKIVGCISHFNDIITDPPSDDKSPDADDEQLVTECYECLTCVAMHSEGRAMLVKEQAVSAFCVATHRKCLCWQKGEDLLLRLVEVEGNSVWRGNEHGLKVLLYALTQQFQESQDASKFETCQKLGCILSTVERENLQGDISQWSSDLYKGLTDILRSKIGAQQRNPALLLASAAVDLLGVSWAMAPAGRVDSEGQQNSQFLLLLVHLTCIEVRMTLEDKTLVEVIEIGPVLVACYRLLENIIAYLSTGPSLALDSRKVGQLHSAMVGAFNAVLFFLTRVSQQHPEQTQSPLVLASLRVLGSWVAEETTALQKEVADILPFIINVCSENLKHHEIFLTPGGDTGSEKMDTGDQSALVPAVIPGGSSVPEVVRFLLPGFCHLSADDEARKVLLASGGTELLVRYFDYQWTFFSSVGNTEDCQMALATLCGVMLNLVVLEGATLAVGETGRMFLGCAFRALPSLEHQPDSIVLALNLCVLGLMMLRHTRDMEQARCEAYCKSAIGLLSRAHCRKRTDTRSWSVHVSETYLPFWSECAELWFLAMQALSDDIGLYPWLPRVVLGSGFLPVIIRLLQDVKGDMERESVTAYQGVLVSMAQHDKTAKRLLREQQVQQLARTHKMEELGRVLAS